MKKILIQTTKSQSPEYRQHHSTHPFLIKFNGSIKGLAKSIPQAIQAANLIRDKQDQPTEVIIDFGITEWQF